MGTGNIPTASSGQKITASHHNSIKSALTEDVVPRNASGVVTNLAGALGSLLYRWANLFSAEVTIGDPSNSALNISQVGDNILVKRGATTISTIPIDAKNLAPTLQYRVFPTSSAGWVPPPDVKWIKWTICGGGGGGGGGSSGTGLGGQGGDGSMAMEFITNIEDAGVSGFKFAFSVGAGGVGGALGNTGITGGETSVDGYLAADTIGVTPVRFKYRVYGGQGGSPNSSSTKNMNAYASDLQAVKICLGGAGGTASSNGNAGFGHPNAASGAGGTGTTNYSGGGGGGGGFMAYAFNGGTFSGKGGKGGNGNSTAGEAGSGSGAGGGGGGGNRAGGNGSAGIIIAEMITAYDLASYVP